MYGSLLGQGGRILECKSFICIRTCKKECRRLTVNVTSITIVYHLYKIRCIEELLKVLL